jgi:hypothetical protein
MNSRNLPSSDPLPRSFSIFSTTICSMTGLASACWVQVSLLVARVGYGRPILSAG